MPSSAKTSKVSRSKKSKSSIKITPEQREHMIAEAAYFLAEQRGFTGGDAITDWLQAESEIDQSLH